MIRHLILTYGYIIVFAGTFFEGETVLMVGGISARLGYLDLVSVMLVATAGSFLGDVFYFFLGRYYGYRLLRWWPSARLGAARVNRLLYRHRILFILGFRFVYGIRTISPFVLGMGSVPAVAFVALNFVSAALWAVVIAALGYAFGEVAARLLAEVMHFEQIAIVGVFAAGAALWLVHFVRIRRRARREEGGQNSGDGDG